MTINTQGMSYGTSKGGGRSIEEQRADLPDMKIVKTNLFSNAFRKELKELINEILHERNDKIN